MLNLPLGPAGPWPMIVSGAEHGGMLGVRPPLPILQMSISLQFGEPWPDIVPLPGLIGVSTVGGPAVKVGVTVRVEVTVGVRVGVPVCVLVDVRVDVAVTVRVGVALGVLVGVRVGVVVGVRVGVLVGV
jgi:hypothetical protein